MSWNYRVCQDIFTHHDPKTGNFIDTETSYHIKEVYYDKHGKPDGYTDRDAGVIATTPEGILDVLEKMRQAVEKPVISLNKFPEEVTIEKENT